MMMKICEYEFRNAVKCEEEALPNSKWCILHIDFPEDEGSEEFKRINKLKVEKVKEKVNKGDFNFEGAKLFRADFEEKKIKNAMNFRDAIIRAGARFARSELDQGVFFEGAEIHRGAYFDGARIGRGIWFNESKIDNGGVRLDHGRIEGDVEFYMAEIDGDVWFAESEIEGGVDFEFAKIRGRAWFDDTKIRKYVTFSHAKTGMVTFNNAKLGGNLRFWWVEIESDAYFDGAEIGGDVQFHGTRIKGNLSFKNTKFSNPHAQEEACRTAKRICEKLGNREDVDYYFYREMEAKRRQKNRIIRFLELPIQHIFGYGTKWERVLITWFSVVFCFAFLFWVGNGVEEANSLWENIYFSIVTATTLGYGDYHPKLGVYQGVASLEAIFGTFMWAAFIVIFARKYMR